MEEVTNFCSFDLSAFSIKIAVVSGIYSGNSCPFINLVCLLANADSINSTLHSAAHHTLLKECQESIKSRKTVFLSPMEVKGNFLKTDQFHLITFNLAR